MKMNGEWSLTSRAAFLSVVSRASKVTGAMAMPTLAIAVDQREEGAVDVYLVDISSQRPDSLVVVNEVQSIASNGGLSGVLEGFFPEGTREHIPVALHLGFGSREKLGKHWVVVDVTLRERHLVGRRCFEEYL